MAYMHFSGSHNCYGPDGPLNLEAGLEVPYTVFPRLDARASISKLCVACPASTRAQASI